MPLTTCPGCGEQTFTITGWADLDHCANCGRLLAMRGPGSLSGTRAAAAPSRDPRPGRTAAPSRANGAGVRRAASPR